MNLELNFEAANTAQTTAIPAVVQQRLVRHWSADCTPEVLAMEMIADLCKKFRQIDAMPSERFEAIAQGLVDGPKATTFPYPGGGSIPDYRRSMKPEYCAGFEVGSTWRKISQEWPNQ